MSETPADIVKATEVQAYEQDRANAQPGLSTAAYDEPGTGSLGRRPDDRQAPDRVSPGRPDQSSAGGPPIEPAAYGRRPGDVPSGRPPAEPGSTRPAQPGAGMSAPSGSYPTARPPSPGATPAPSRFSSPAASAAAPDPATVSPASPSPASTAPASARPESTPSWPQPAAATTYEPASTGRYGRQGTGSYDHPAGATTTGAHGRAVMPSAPDDEIHEIRVPPAPVPPAPAPLGTAPLGTGAAAHVPAAEQVAAPGPAAAVVKGRVHIEDEVVEKVAGLAAVEVAGVADLGGKAARSREPIREYAGVGVRRGIPGVQARVEDRQVAIHVMIVIEYGSVVMEVAKAVKANVARALSHMLSLRVVEVNVTVDDVTMPQHLGGGAHAAGHAGIDGPAPGSAG